MKIENVPVFAVGKWNGHEFDRGDLDEMARAFEEQKLSGKLPVKLGHSTRDGEPAQGWITSLVRDGDQLFATLDQVPANLVEDIKAGRFRHVSIELLGNVTRGGKSYRWMPDGLAILGAARPAVDVLRGLHELVATALPGLAFKERLAFSRETADETTRLRDENADLRKLVIEGMFDREIIAGRILPNIRVKYFKRHPDGGTVAFAREAIAEAPRPDRSNAGRARVDRNTAEFSANPMDELVALTSDLIDQWTAAGKPADYMAATKVIFKRRPDLAREWASSNGVS